MFTFLEHAHMSLTSMFDVTEQVGLGWGDPQGYLNQKDLMQYVHRWQWRRSCDNDLFTSLGQACKKLRR